VQGLKKNEINSLAVDIVEKVHLKSGESYRQVCVNMKIPYASLMRWRIPWQEGKPVVNRPGPAKVKPLDQEKLLADIGNLEAGKERTHGSGALWKKYMEQISRRDYLAIVAQFRAEVNQEKSALERKVEWLRPGFVWSMDDMEKHWLSGRFGHVDVMMDLGSKYNLRVFGDDAQMSGLHIALDTEEQFKVHGAPLFLKVDGGSNFRHEEVRKLCDRWMVIMLVSPPYYPKFNGAVEREHQELLAQFEKRIGERKVTAEVLRLESEVIGHEVNHKPRPILGGRTPCQVLTEGKGWSRAYGRRKRREVYEFIYSLAIDLVQELKETTRNVTETAFRYAAEAWMQLNGLIRVSQNGRVLPCLYQI
jgi:hypothetical protein